MPPRPMLRPVRHEMRVAANARRADESSALYEMNERRLRLYSYSVEKGEAVIMAGVAAILESVSDMSLSVVDYRRLMTLWGKPLGAF